jgi:hypothetical protein
MDANEIVAHREQRDRMRLILDLLAESIGEPSKPASVHPHTEVRPFRVAGRNMLGIGIAFDPLLMRADALCGAVAALGAFGSRAVAHVQQVARIERQRNPGLAFKLADRSGFHFVQSGLRLLYALFALPP